MGTHSREKRGQSLVELALLLPFLLWVCAGIVDFGRVYYYQVAAINAARSGARVAADQYATSAAILAAAQADAAGSKITLTGPLGINNPSADVNMTYVSSQPSDPGWRVAGDDVTITVTYRFRPFTPLIDKATGGTITVRRAATMKVVY